MRFRRYVVKWDTTVQASYQGAGEKTNKIFGVLLPNDLAQKYDLPLRIGTKTTLYSNCAIQQDLL